MSSLSTKRARQPRRGSPEKKLGSPNPHFTPTHLDTLGALDTYDTYDTVARAASPPCSDDAAPSKSDNHRPTVMMASESATPVDKASTPSPSEAQPPSPPPAAAELSDTSDSDSDDQEPQVEWLATARERRSTAGNRMKSMLAAEEPDDDLELLFAEDENDQGFSDAGDDGSDVHMDSSSDDEDNNAADADEMEGEKELEKQAKERRAAQRKRKAQDAIPAKFRKKVRINTEAPPPRPKKKSERASWLPSPADLPTRASARSTTRMSKEQLHTQMVEREARRLKQVAQMQKKAAKLEAMRKPPMTQEERLKEAEKVEMRNRGSLNRWEEAERAREEERLRKLKALTERRLEGPVITFWSGVREGQGPRYVEMEEKPVRKKKEKPAKEKQETADKKEGGNDQTPKPDGSAAADVTKHAETHKAEAGDNKVDATEKAGTGSPKAGTSETTSAVQPEGENSPKETPGTAPPSPADAKETSADAKRPTSDEPEKPVEESKGTPVGRTESKVGSPAPEATRAATPQQKDTEASKTPAEEPGSVSKSAEPSTLPAKSQASDPSSSTPAPASAATESKPPSVLAAPVLAAPPSNTGQTPASSSSSVLAAPDTTRGSLPPPTSQEPSQQPAAEPAIQDAVFRPIDTEATGTTASTTNGTHPPSADQSHQSVPISEQANEAAPAAAVHGTETVKAPRNAIIFQNFNEAVIRDKSIQTQILFGQKMAKLSKPAPNPVCVITNRPARYRDPSTGLPFATAHAYHEIRRLIKGEYKWSRLLGAWVGTGAYAARGVPDRFLNPNAEGPVREKKDGDGGGEKRKDEGSSGPEGKGKGKEDAKIEAVADKGPLDVSTTGTEVVAT